MTTITGPIPAFSSIRLVRLLLWVSLTFWGCLLLGLAWAAC